MLTKIGDIKTKFLNFKDKFKSEDKAFEDFIKLFNKKRGSIYEYVNVINC